MNNYRGHSSVEKKSFFSRRWYAVIAFLALYSTSVAQGYNYYAKWTPIMNSVILNNTTIDGGAFGYRLEEVNGETLISRNSNYQFYPASTVKWLHAGTMLWRVRNAPDPKVALQNAQVRVYYIPSQSCANSHVGHKATIENGLFAIKDMMQQSDNQVTNGIQEWNGGGSASIGMSMINHFTQNVCGVSNTTNLYHKLGCGNISNPVPNKMTLAGINKFVESLSDNPTAFKTDLWDLLKDDILIKYARGSLVEDVIDEYNINLTSEEITDFKSRIRDRAKGGSISGHYSRAGWIRVPFKTSSGIIVNRKFVYSYFLNDVGASQNRDDIVNTLIKPVILTALETWTTKDAAITKVSETTEGVTAGSSDHIDVTTLNSYRIIAPMRTTANKLFLHYYRFNGNSLTKQHVFNSNIFIKNVQSSKLHSARFVTACRRTNDYFRLDVWDLTNGATTITKRGYKGAGKVKGFDIIHLTSSRFATPVRTWDNKLKVIIWDVSNTGAITRKGDYTLGSASIVKGQRVSNNEFVTGSKWGSTLTLQYWYVTSTGNLVLRGTKTESNTDDFGLSHLYGQRIVTSIESANDGRFRTVAWDFLKHLNQWDRLGEQQDFLVNNVDGAGLRKTRVVSVGRNKIQSGQLLMMVYDVHIGGEVVRAKSKFHNVTVGQVHVDKVTGSTYNQKWVVATTKQSGQLWVSVWNAFGYAKSGELVEEKVEEEDVVQSVVQLSNVYPNPSQGDVNVVLNIEASKHIKVDIYNISGQHMANINNTALEKGTHELVWNSNNVVAGTYLIKVQTEDSVVTKKVFVRK